MSRNRGHHFTCQHRAYRMTCAEFDALASRAGGRCEICGTPEPETTRGVLCIDHDRRRGFAAVRGLVCDKCNTHVGMVEAGRRPLDDETRAYLTRSESDLGLRRLREPVTLTA